MTTAPPSTASTATQTLSGSGQPSSFPKLISRVRSGVVRIEVTTCDVKGVGTGLILGPRLVATVGHVVDGASSIDVKRSGRVMATGQVIGTDADRDLALIRTSKPLKGYHFKFADRAPQLGESVAALGYPLGLPLTVTRGR